jgi:hypothetical protein
MSKYDVCIDCGCPVLRPRRDRPNRRCKSCYLASFKSAEPPASLVPPRQTPWIRSADGSLTRLSSSDPEMLKEPATEQAA